jgi:hypothetical protein
VQEYSEPVPVEQASGVEHEAFGGGEIDGHGNQASLTGHSTSLVTTLVNEPVTLVALVAILLLSVVMDLVRKSRRS